eukprot:tig00020710_g13331.t1
MRALKLQQGFDTVKSLVHMLDGEVHDRLLSASLTFAAENGTQEFAALVLQRWRAGERAPDAAPEEAPEPADLDDEAKASPLLPF